jgi:hypothetical protein
VTGWRTVGAAEFRAMPWKNGGGTTWEIAQGRFSGDPEADWDWRFSLAEIASAGPFSAFPGIDRLLTVISGAGILLTIDQTPPRRLEPGEDIAFAGEASVDCALLGGVTRDLNVMVDRRLARIVPGRNEARLVAGAGLILLYAQEEVRVATAQGDVRVAAGDALIGVADAEGDIIGGRAVWVRVERLAA